MKRKYFNAVCIILSLILSLQVTAQIPKLNSLPTASATIFLDFDGQTVVSPYWYGGNPIYCTPAAMSLDQLRMVFEQVSEDFRPFNINITTDSTVYFAAPAQKRQRVIVTAFSSWYGSAGGVAYVESFRWGMEVPAFVFSTLLGNRVKRVADASSHEVGHTLGLYHQALYDASCNVVTDYNPGTGTGETSWAPLMGNSYSKNLSLWHNGPNSFGCASMQDDAAIIAGPANGFGYRSDDVANTSSSAPSINISSTTFNLSGLVNTTNDVDFYNVTLPSKGQLTINGLPTSLDPNTNLYANIDLQLQLINSTGTIIGVYNPTTSVKAIVDTLLNAGTYYIKVANVSNSNATNYGMIGSYRVSGSYVASAALPIYSLVLNGQIANNKHELNWNIVADEPIESISIESSFDGRNFSKLEAINGTARKFQYQPAEKAVVYYRLHVVTASQLTYYSNIISLNEVTAESRYNLLTNVIHNNTVVVNSQGNLNWRMVDLNGRTLMTGKMTTGVNRIDAARLPQGMLLLQILDGATVKTEKLIKQ